jgi:hypothetical protein
MYTTLLVNPSFNFVCVLSYKVLLSSSELSNESVNDTFGFAEVRLRLIHPYAARPSVNYANPLLKAIAFQQFDEGF